MDYHLQLRAIWQVIRFSEGQFYTDVNWFCNKILDSIPIYHDSFPIGRLSARHSVLCNKSNMTNKHIHKQPCDTLWMTHFASHDTLELHCRTLYAWHSNVSIASNQNPIENNTHIHPIHYLNHITSNFGSKHISVHKCQSDLNKLRRRL